jgi:hypothetical protein
MRTPFGFSALQIIEYFNLSNLDIRSYCPIFRSQSSFSEKNQTNPPFSARAVCDCWSAMFNMSNNLADAFWMTAVLKGNSIPYSLIPSSLTL